MGQRVEYCSTETTPSLCLSHTWITTWRNTERTEDAVQEKAGGYVHYRKKNKKLEGIDIERRVNKIVI